MSSLIFEPIFMPSTPWSHPLITPLTPAVYLWKKESTQRDGEDLQTAHAEGE